MEHDIVTLYEGTGQANSGVTASTAMSASAMMARRSSRELTRQVPIAERQALYEEHRELTARLFESGLSDQDTRRLNYVRWRLDRIEDAEIGDNLDTLQLLAENQQRLADRILRAL